MICGSSFPWREQQGRAAEEEGKNNEQDGQVRPEEQADDARKDVVTRNLDGLAGNDFRSLCDSGGFDCLAHEPAPFSVGRERTKTLSPGRSPASTS
jgi:hypothetical protein